MDDSRNPLGDPGPQDEPLSLRKADPEPKGPSPQEMATANALAWWNGLAGIPPGQIFDMLKQQQGMPR